MTVQDHAEFQVSLSRQQWTISHRTCCDTRQERPLLDNRDHCREMQQADSCQQNSLQCLARQTCNECTARLSTSAAQEARELCDRINECPWRGVQPHSQRTVIVKADNQWHQSALNCSSRDSVRWVLRSMSQSVVLGVHGVTLGLSLNHFYIDLNQTRTWVFCVETVALQQCFCLPFS